MRDLIISTMATLGWSKDRVVDVFSCQVETFFGSDTASIWLVYDKETCCWWFNSGVFTSAGENVLATAYASIDDKLPKELVIKTIEAFVVEINERISTAYSVRLLRS